MTTQQVTSETPGLHPVVRRAIRQLEANAEGLGGWDTITVQSRPYTMPYAKRTDTWHTIHAERHPGTLASTSVQIFVLATGPFRGRFLGGRRYAFPSSLDRKITTWRDLSIYAF